MPTPTQPLTAIRNITDPALANVTVALARPGRLHRLVDPDAGDTLMVVTAPPPVRGFIKRQDFVEIVAARNRSTASRFVQTPTMSRAELASDKIIARQARRPDAVVGRCVGASARRSGDPADLRCRRVAQEPGRELHRAQRRAGRGAGGDRARPAHAGADRSGAFLSGARHVSGSQGRARPRARGRQAGSGGSGRADRACGRQHPDGRVPGSG